MKNNRVKKKKNQKKGRANYLKICIITIIVVLLGVGIYFFLTADPLIQETNRSKFCAQLFELLVFFSS